MKIVVKGSSGNSGRADRITLPNGKYFYTGTDCLVSMAAKEAGFEVKEVVYYGSCIYSNINDRAHEGFPIQIDEVSVADFIDQIATAEECRQFMDSL